ncbi:hypothetical protein ABT373_38090 [Streptomyces sp. NPDC000070]|uniref:hypothetical protein n=1 Tax=Streptomyces sp. NPDC000070 TaxID=3154240 RepID=UPI00332D74E0
MDIIEAATLGQVCHRLAPCPSSTRRAILSEARFATVVFRAFSVSAPTIQAAPATQPASVPPAHLRWSEAASSSSSNPPASRINGDTPVSKLGEELGAAVRAQFHGTPPGGLLQQTHGALVGARGELSAEPRPRLFGLSLFFNPSTVVGR